MRDGAQICQIIGQDHEAEKPQHRPIRRREGTGLPVFRPPEQSGPGPVQLPEKCLGKAASPAVGGVGIQKDRKLCLEAFKEAQRSAAGVHLDVSGVCEAGVAEIQKQEGDQRPRGGQTGEKPPGRKARVGERREPLLKGVEHDQHAPDREALFTVVREPGAAADPGRNTAAPGRRAGCAGALKKQPAAEAVGGLPPLKAKPEQRFPDLGIRFQTAASEGEQPVQQEQRGEALLPVDRDQAAVLLHTAAEKAQIHAGPEAGGISGGLPEGVRQIVQELPADAFGFRIQPPLDIIPVKSRDTDAETADREQAPEAFTRGGDRGEGRCRMRKEAVIEGEVRKGRDRIGFPLPGRVFVLRPGQIGDPRLCGFERVHRLGRHGFREGTGRVFSFHARYPPASEKNRGNG